MCVGIFSKKGIIHLETTFLFKMYALFSKKKIIFVAELI